MIFIRRSKFANQPSEILETLEKYIDRAKRDESVGKHGQPRRTFDNFRGILPENFKAIQSQISTFFQNKTNLQEIFENFDKEFDKFAVEKNYSPEETIKYKSALFFKLISLYWVGKTDIDINLSNYAQKTSGEFFSPDKKQFMTLDQYYQQIVIPKMMDNIKPLIQHVKNFSDDEISDLVSKERHFDKLPKQFQDQLLDETKKFLSTQTSQATVQAVTKSSVNAQPSQAPVQAETESFVSDQKSIENASLTKLSNSKLNTGEKIGRALGTAAGFIGVAFATAALIGGLSFVAPFVIPAVGGMAALTMIGGVLLSERIPFLGKLFSRKEPQSVSQPNGNSSHTSDNLKEDSNTCSTSTILGETSYNVSYEHPAENVRNPVPPPTTQEPEKNSPEECQSPGHRLSK